LTDADLLFPDSDAGNSAPRGDIVGAITENTWVIFHGLQVIQIVPEEVHTGWQYEAADSGVSTCAWRVIESEWLGSFDPRHLSDHIHFVLAFYDDIVELICRELLFGEMPFDLARAISIHPQLGYAYLRLANSLRKQNEIEGAITNYEKYVACNPDVSSAEFAKRCIDSLRSR